MLLYLDKKLKYNVAIYLANDCFNYLTLIKFTIIAKYELKFVSLLDTTEQASPCPAFIQPSRLIMSH